MAEISPQFRTPHNAAFRQLGAMAPGQQWSAFDVPFPRARKGEATRFITTIWNMHSVGDERRRRTPTELAVVQNRDGTFWYRMTRPAPGTTRKTWVAHWNALLLALDAGLPIIGVLKDAVTGRCSLDHLFDCGPAREQIDGSAIWLQLRPRGEVGCEVVQLDLAQVVAGLHPTSPLAEVSRKLEELVVESMRGSSTKRMTRLQSAPRLPRRITVTTTVFDRNPDVIAEVLLRAAGRCEVCENPAPFMRRSDGSPYLEVHHRRPLALGGEDTVENAVAVCPNCHRQAHYA